jgi:hypothetical protein
MPQFKNSAAAYRGRFYSAFKSVPLYPETQFLLHALKSEMSRDLFLRACLDKKKQILKIRF